MNQESESKFDIGMKYADANNRVMTLRHNPPKGMTQAEITHELNNQLMIRDYYRAQLDKLQKAS